MLRRDFRTFRLDRIGACTVTDRIFADEPGRSLGDYLRMVEEELAAWRRAQPSP